MLTGTTTLRLYLLLASSPLSIQSTGKLSSDREILESQHQYNRDLMTFSWMRCRRSGGCTSCDYMTAVIRLATGWRYAFSGFTFGFITSRLTPLKFYQQLWSRHGFIQPWNVCILWVILKCLISVCEGQSSSSLICDHCHAWLYFIPAHNTFVQSDTLRWPQTWTLSLWLFYIK